GLPTLPLVDARGIAFPFALVPVGRAVYAVAAWLVLREAPGRTMPDTPLGRRLAATLRLPVTWQMSALYAVVFGGFVAFSVYLPTYLDRKSTRLNSSHVKISYAVFCLKKKRKKTP